MGEYFFGMSVARLKYTQNTTHFTSLDNLVQNTSLYSVYLIKFSAFFKTQKCDPQSDNYRFTKTTAECLTQVKMKLYGTGIKSNDTSFWPFFI